MDEALRLKVAHERRMQALDEFIAAHEAVCGEITEDEMREASRQARARAGPSDAVDAALVCLAADGDEILTADADDLRPPAETAGVHVDLIPV